MQSADPGPTIPVHDDQRRGHGGDFCSVRVNTQRAPEVGKSCYSAGTHHCCDWPLVHAQEPRVLGWHGSRRRLVDSALSTELNPLFTQGQFCVTTGYGFV